MEKQEKWLYFARYWIGFPLSRIHEGWSHLSQPDPVWRARPQWVLGRASIPVQYRKLLDDLTAHTVQDGGWFNAIVFDPDKTCKSTYNIIQKRTNDNIQIDSQVHWDLMLGRLRSPRVRWKRVWTHHYASYNVGLAPDTLFKLLHQRTQTKVKLRNRNPRYDTRCPVCRRQDETCMHLFVRCATFSNLVWARYMPVFRTLFPGERLVFEEMALTVTVQDKDKKDKSAKLFRTIVEVILHEIWSARCKCLHEHIQPNVDRTIRSIRSNLAKVIKAHYRHHIFYQSIDFFVENFCINGAVCTLDDADNLRLLLPT